MRVFLMPGGRRIMRNTNMPVDDIIEQISYVTLTVKNGLEVSDLRHHTFRGRLRKGKVVYFRGSIQGACDYMDDRREHPVAYGTRWLEVADCVEVIDVPGDHFSLLRQDWADMNVMAEAMKAHLMSYGWQELPAGDAAAQQAVPETDAAQVASLLREMGADDAAIEAARKYVSEGAGAGVLASSAVDRGNIAAEAVQVARAARGAAGDAVLLLGWAKGAAEATWRWYGKDAYAIAVEQPRGSEDAPEAAEVVRACVAAARRTVGTTGRPVTVAALGAAVPLGYAVTCALECAGVAVSAFVAFEDAELSFVSESRRQPWLVCWPLVAGMSRMKVDEYVRRMGRVLEGAGECLEPQLVELMRLCPDWLDLREWEAQVRSISRRMGAVSIAQA